MLWTLIVSRSVKTLFVRRYLSHSIYLPVFIDLYSHFKFIYFTKKMNNTFRLHIVCFKLFFIYARITLPLYKCGWFYIYIKKVFCWKWKAFMDKHIVGWKSLLENYYYYCHFEYVVFCISVIIRIFFCQRITSRN